MKSTKTVVALTLALVSSSFGLSAYADEQRHGRERDAVEHKHSNERQRFSSHSDGRDYRVVRDYDDNLPAQRRHRVYTEYVVPRYRYDRGQVKYRHGVPPGHAKHRHCNDPAHHHHKPVRYPTQHVYSSYEVLPHRPTVGYDWSISIDYVDFH